MVDTAGAKKRSHLVRNLALLAVGLVVCMCVGLIGLSRIVADDPAVQATGTSRSATRTHDAGLRLTPSATPLPSPSETPLPPTGTTVPTPTNTAGPSPTPIETSTPQALGLSLSEFVVRYESLTDLQREGFIAELPGKTVDWTGKVYDVDDRGIFIDMPGSIWNGYTVLTDVPEDIALTINRDSRIRFTATIDHTANFIFFYIYLVDVEVIQ